MHDNTGEQVQRDTQTGIIAGIETSIIALSVAAELYKSRPQTVQVKIKPLTNNVPADLQKARDMLVQHKSTDEIAAQLRLGSIYQKIQKSNGKGEQYIDEIIESAQRKNSSKYNPSSSQQKTHKPRKTL